MENSNIIEKKQDTTIYTQYDPFSPKCIYTHLYDRKKKHDKILEVDISR